MTYNKIDNGNVKSGSINYAIIITRQKSGKTGGTYINTAPDQESVTLIDNVLKITAGTWWIQVCIKKL